MSAFHHGFHNRSPLVLVVAVVLLVPVLLGFKWLLTSGAALGTKYCEPHIDLNKTVDIPSRDFQDLSHLIAPGRVIGQHAPAASAPLLSADSGGSRG